MSLRKPGNLSSSSSSENLSHCVVLAYLQPSVFPSAKPQDIKEPLTKSSLSRETPWFRQEGISANTCHTGWDKNWKKKKKRKDNEKGGKSHTHPSSDTLTVPVISQTKGNLIAAINPKELTERTNKVKNVFQCLYHRYNTWVAINIYNSCIFQLWTCSLQLTEFLFTPHLILKCQVVKCCEEPKQKTDNSVSYKLKSCCWDLAKGEWLHPHTLCFWTYQS